MPTTIEILDKLIGELFVDENDNTVFMIVSYSYVKDPYIEDCHNVTMRLLDSNNKMATCRDLTLHKQISLDVILETLDYYFSLVPLLVEE